MTRLVSSRILCYCALHILFYENLSLSNTLYFMGAFYRIPHNQIDSVTLAESLFSANKAVFYLMNKQICRIWYRKLLYQSLIDTTECKVEFKIVFTNPHPVSHVCIRHSSSAATVTSNCPHHILNLLAVPNYATKIF